jgi:FkbM family methyltransferase
MIKRLLKSFPVLHGFLLPFVERARKWKKARRLQRELIRFRKRCLYLSLAIPEPVFVKVGANDGITGDPCSDILLAHKAWTGILIEPVPYCFQKLKVNFSEPRFRLEQTAIGAVAGEATFYYVDQEARKALPLPEWFDQLGSFDRSHIVKHLDGILEPFILEAKVEVCPMSEVLARNHVQEIHLLHIDTEGYDYEVLRTLDFSRYRPLLIFIEHKHLAENQKADMRSLLHQHGYTIYECGGDYCAVHARWRT